MSFQTDSSVSYDVVVVGGGITGLMLTYKLTRLGLRVLLIEKTSHFAGGTSTRNEGWLHRGSYHAYSIRDRSKAVAVARQCIYGHEKIREFVPEAVYDIHGRSYALLNSTDESTYLELLTRWNDAEVRYKELTGKQISSLLSFVDSSHVAHAFQVDDVSIDSRILYRKLHALGSRSGAHYWVNAEPVGYDGASLFVRRQDKTHVGVRAELYIYAAGVGLPHLFRRIFDIDVNLRLWKSHLIITRRIIEPAVFFLDPGEAGIMHHIDWSIVGCNEDAQRVESEDDSIEPMGVKVVTEAYSRMLASVKDYKFKAVACTKVDWEDASTEARSLSVAFNEPIPNHIWMLPGKMTEAAYAVDSMTRVICQRLPESIIANRPCDLWDNQ